MVIVGIDMSRNSPGVCIRTDEELKFLSFIRGAETKKISAHYNSLRDCGVEIYPNKRSADSKDYSISEGYKIMDATLLARSIVDSLPSEIDMVGLEGFSYGSKGNSGLDIAGYAYCLRMLLFEKYGSSKLRIFSPSNVKKKAGKGNAGKDEIMNFFLLSNDLTLRRHPLWVGLSEGEIDKRKPVDDLIDAYYVQECTLEAFRPEIIESL